MRSGLYQVIYGACTVKIDGDPVAYEQSRAITDAKMATGGVREVVIHYERGTKNTLASYDFIFRTTGEWDCWHFSTTGNMGGRDIGFFSSILQLSVDQIYKITDQLPKLLYRGMPSNMRDAYDLISRAKQALCSPECSPPVSIRSCT